LNVTSARENEREMIVTRQGKTRRIIPAIIEGDLRVDTMIILGVAISFDLKAKQHINKILTSAASTTYMLGTLQNHGLNEKG